MRPSGSPLHISPGECPSREARQGADALEGVGRIKRSESATISVLWQLHQLPPHFVRFEERAQAHEDHKDLRQVLTALFRVPLQLLEAAHAGTGSR